MKKRIYGSLAAIIFQLIMVVSTSPVNAAPIQEDLFLENTYEDYTLSTGNFWAGNRQMSEFSAMETGQNVSDADIFLERVYEDYTLGQ